MIPISTVKDDYTPEKEIKLLSYIQLVALCAEIIMIEYQDTAISTRFKNPAINNHSKRIVESADAIRKHLSFLSENKDREKFMYSSSLQFHRVFKFFMEYPPEKLEELMDTLDKEFNNLK